MSNIEILGVIILVLCGYGIGMALTAFLASVFPRIFLIKHDSDIYASAFVWPYGLFIACIVAIITGASNLGKKARRRLNGESAEVGE